MADDLDAKRHLDLEGTFNVRDIGGYATEDGHRTRWGRFLRSDSLHRLPIKSQAALLEYGVRTIIDLRRSQQIQSTPNVFFGSDELAYYHQNMVGDAALSERAEIPKTLPPAERIRRVYCLILDRRQSQVHDTLATLAAPDALPALVHCAGGKDRTGMIAALVLGIAGVPADTIAEDYALTARFLHARYLEAHPDVSAEDYTWQDYQRASCPPETMLGVLRHVDDRYGSVEGYARAIGLIDEQIESLREGLVE